MVKTVEKEELGAISGEAIGERYGNAIPKIVSKLPSESIVTSQQMGQTAKSMISKE